MNDENEIDDLWDAGDGAGSEVDGGSWAPLGGQSSIDDMARTLSTFGMRIDALVTSTTSYRAAITDRLVEYADTVNKLVKNQSSDLEEHRVANQRLLAELQRGITTSDDSVNGLAERIDELLSSGSADDSSRQVLAEVRSVLDAQERLGQFLTEALDQFGDRVTERLDASQTGSVDQLDSLASTLTAVQRSDQAMESSLAEVITELRNMRDALVDLASGDVVGALWDEVRALRETVAGLDRTGGTSSVGSDADIAGLTDAVSRLLDAAEVVPPDEPDALGVVTGDLAQLRADLTEGLVIEPDAALTSALDDIRTRVTAVRDSLAAGVDARPTAQLTDALDQIRSGVDALGGRLDDVLADADGLRWPGGGTGTTRSAPELERLADELAAARSEVAAIGTRLDEGLVIDAPSGSDVDVADRVGALRDEVTTELEAVRQILADAVEQPPTPDSRTDDVEVVVDLDPVVALIDELRDEVRAIPQHAPVETPAPGDDSIAALRDEVRALAEAPESFSESVRTELIALRRRIKVRSEADVLTDDQLDRIAQAVADRLS